MNLFSASCQSAPSKLVPARQDDSQYFSPRVGRQLLAAGGLMQLSFIAAGLMPLSFIAGGSMPLSFITVAPGKRPLCGQGCFHSLSLCPHNAAVARQPLQLHCPQLPSSSSSIAVDTSCPGPQRRGRAAHLAALAADLPLLVGQTSLFPLRFESEPGKRTSDLAATDLNKEKTEKTRGSHTA